MPSVDYVAMHDHFLSNAIKCVNLFLFHVPTNFLCVLIPLMSPTMLHSHSTHVQPMSIICANYVLIPLVSSPCLYTNYVLIPAMSSSSLLHVSFYSHSHSVPLIFHTILIKVLKLYCILYNSIAHTHFILIPLMIYI